MGNTLKQPTRPTVTHEALVRLAVIAAVGAATALMNHFDQSTAAGLAGYWGLKTLIDYLNPAIPNTSNPNVPGLR